MLQNPSIKMPSPVREASSVFYHCNINNCHAEEEITKTAFTKVLRSPHDKILHNMMWNFIENWRGHKWKQIFSVSAMPKKWLQRGHNPNLDVNHAEMKGCWKLELFRGCAEHSLQLHPPHPPKIPAAAVELSSKHITKFYQQWHQMGDDKQMNCERLCLF